MEDGDHRVVIGTFFPNKIIVDKGIEIVRIGVIDEKEFRRFPSIGGVTVDPEGGILTSEEGGMDP